MRFFVSVYSKLSGTASERERGDVFVLAKVGSKVVEVGRGDPLGGPR